MPTLSADNKGQLQMVVRLSDGAIVVVFNDSHSKEHEGEDNLDTTSVLGFSDAIASPHSTWLAWSTRCFA